MSAVKFKPVCRCASFFSRRILFALGLLQLMMHGTGQIVQL